MKTIIAILVLLAIYTASALDTYKPVRRNHLMEDSLVMVHVLFRHGQRTPDVSTIYPNDPYKNETYFPYGLGALTNEGKRTEFNIGKALRERYHEFFGSYSPNKIHAQASPFSRTKISAQLVLASLFPPIGVEKWNHKLNWQPIDYDYNPRNEDLLFLHGLNCEKYIQLSNEQLEMAVQQGEFGNYEDVSEYLQYHSGWSVQNPEFAFNIYSALLTEEEWGFELPDWTGVVYPEPLHSIAVQYLAQLVKTDRLKQLSGGFLLRHIVEETLAKLNGTASLQDRRVSLYSGHDFTIVALLGVLGVFEAHQPPYGSYVILEVHQIGNTHGIKLFYQNYTTRTPQQINIPGCDMICPLDKFISLYSRLFPNRDLCKVKG